MAKLGILMAKRPEGRAMSNTINQKKAEAISSEIIELLLLIIWYHSNSWIVHTEAWD